MIEWTTVASLSTRVASTSYSNRHFIQKWWKKAHAYLDKGNTNILVTGRPNTGKSVLVSQLHGEAQNLYYELPKESRNVEVAAVTLGEWTKLIRTLPGQSSAIRTHGINEAFDNNKNLEGIIHVVDFGYTLPRDSTIALSLVQNAKIDTIEKLRNYNLNNEIDEIQNLIISIERSLVKQNCPNWLIIAVNKIDLFKNDLNESLLFYHPDGTSEFSKKLKNLQNKIGTNSLQIHVIATCAFEEDFHWNDIRLPSSLKAQEHKNIMRSFMDALVTIAGA